MKISFGKHFASAPPNAHTFGHSDEQFYISQILGHSDEQFQNNCYDVLKQSGNDQSNEICSNMLPQDMKWHENMERTKRCALLQCFTAPQNPRQAYIRSSNFSEILSFYTCI
jgi:hypothetical protein